MTAEEFYRLPDGPPYFQLVDGELFMSPSPNFFHQSIVVELAFLIRSYLRQHPIGKVIVAPADVELDHDNVIQPDLYFIRSERFEIVDDHGVKGAPDLIVEVISGSTGRLDLGPKKSVCAAKGVVEFWAVYPQERQIEVYRLAESVSKPARTLREGDSLDSALLPGLEISVAEIFAR
jgi:Uma2 family endonuclease